METSEVQATVEPRKIDELLKLETFADMTDEEISLVLEYKVSQAVRSEEMEARKEAIAQAGHALIANAQQQREHAQSVLESLVANPPQFYKVEV